MSRSWQISRRTMLRGLGVTIALPVLDAMTGSALSGEDPGKPDANQPRFKAPRTPIRLAMLNLPCGTFHKEWEPDAPGPLGELKPFLKPLQKFTPDMLLLSNLWNKSATADGITHYANEACFFTGMPVHKTTGADVNVNGISIDQIAARCTGTVTRFPSIHINMQAPIGGTDTGWARMYNNQLSWSTPTTPVPNEIDPKRMFDRLFRGQGQGAGGGAVAAQALSEDDQKSVLDYAQDEAKALKLKVGVNDQRKLDEYLTSVRDVERQLDREIRELAKERRVDPTAVRAVGMLDGQLVAFDGRDHTNRTRLMLDMITLAFWTDSTRVATFMFGNERNDMNYTFLDGVKSTHHEASHYTESDQRLADFRKISLWIAEQTAYFLGRMKGIKEANGGTLLDNSMIFWGSSLSDGNNHGKENLPIMLAGRGGGLIKPGRHLSLAAKTPLCNLYLAMMQCQGVQIDTFADSTGPLQEIAKM